MDRPFSVKYIWGYILDLGNPDRMIPGDLKTRYTHLARFARYVPCGRNIQGTQDEPLGFAFTATCRVVTCL
jgi:hypothetical protein